MLLRLLFTFTFMLSFSVLALDKKPAKAPPTEINQELKYVDLLPHFNQGQPTPEENLIGLWKMIATTSSKNCAFSKDQTNWNGISNEDGSWVVLSFNYQDKYLVGANPIEKVFAVFTYNQGGANTVQGPYEVSKTEPNFSNWGYVNGNLTSEAYYVYSCRNVLGNIQQLICSSQLFVSGSLAKNPSTKKCAADKKGFMTLFVKYQ